MRKLLILSALSILCANAQSVQQNCQQIGASSIYVISVNWTASSSGSVPQTLLQCPIIPTIQGYRVVNAEATPGSTAPTNGYSITLLDSSGVDIMASAMLALSSTSPASFQASPTAPPIFGALNFTLTGNSVNSATGRILIYFAPLQQIVGLTPTAPSFPAQGADIFYASPCGTSGSPGFRALCTSDFSASLIPPSSLNAGINLAGTGGGGVTGTLPGSDMSAVNLAASGNGGVTGTAPSGNGGTGVASPTAHTVAVAEGSSPFNFVGPGTAGQILTSNGPGNDPSWQGTQLPSGSQTQYLQLTPNSIATAYRFNSIGSASIADYNFPAQTPGGTLTGGLAATITLTPVPLGVNATNQNYYIYISGGSGTAEPCLVTGGTATSGSSTGTVVCTPANTHSGAWTVTSSTAGVQEAIDANCAGAGTYCSIVVPSGIWTIYAPIVFMSSSSFLNSNITLYGYGQSSELQRGTGFVSGNMIWMGSPSLTNPGAYYSIHDLFLYTPNNLAVTSGAAIEITVNSAVSNQVHNVVIWNGYDGVYCNDCYATLTDVTYLQTSQAVSNSIAAHSGLWLNSTQTTGPSSVLVENCSFATQNSLSTYSLQAGILINAADGVVISNTGAIGQYGILMTTNGTSDLNDVYITNAVIDSPQLFGVVLSGTTPSGRFVGNIRIVNSHIYDYQNATNSQNGIDVNGISGTWTNVILANNNIGGFLLYGIRVGGGATNVVITGNQIMNNGDGGISLLSGLTSTTITGNTFGNLPAQVPTQTVGLIVTQGLTYSNISYNNFTSLTTPYEISTPGSVTTSVFDGNQGFGTPSVASASALQLPLAPNFELTGTTGVTSVNIPWPAGTHVSFVATASSPGAWSAGGGILNTFTPIQNVPVDCVVVTGPSLACHP